ncbi:ComF family protein [Nitrospira sp. KM1]|uniref:ComF family protein n=1 Tax=Nitrospira sp. KM1 TaxID=1936990 RepID=UPI0015663B28|nr:phosphoribosyltransferase family protein [Nitrospira sp. KM1]
MPVPLHSSRLRGREFNQSLLLADNLSRHLVKPVLPNALMRVTATEPQTTLSRHDRLRNLRNAFAIRDTTGVQERRILVIDDVFTTGTTVNECAEVLRKAGALSVTVLTLARTIPGSLVPDRIVAKPSSRPLSTLGC